MTETQAQKLRFRKEILLNCSDLIERNTWRGLRSGSITNTGEPNQPESTKHENNKNSSNMSHSNRLRLDRFTRRNQDTAVLQGGSCFGVPTVE